MRNNHNNNYGVDTEQLRRMPAVALQQYPGMPFMQTGTPVTGVHGEAALYQPVHGSLSTF